MANWIFGLPFNAITSHEVNDLLEIVRKRVTSASSILDCRLADDIHYQPPAYDHVKPDALPRRIR